MRHIAITIERQAAPLLACPFCFRFIVLGMNKSAAEAAIEHLRRCKKCDEPEITATVSSYNGRREKWLLNVLTRVAVRVEPSRGER